jgi:uncharacterized protein with HEPN domain
MEMSGTRFHIFVVPDADIPIVIAVTAMVKEATKHLPDAMRKKAFRVLLFRQLRDLLKMMYDETKSAIICGTIAEDPVEKKV